MKKGKKKRIRLCIVLVIILILVGSLLWITVDQLKKFKGKKVPEVKVVDKLENYDYVLEENESKYYKDLFQELKKILNAESLEEEAYAQKIGQLFLTDFYHLNNKSSKNDIGGTQFIYETYRTTFEKKAKDTIYRYIENNIYNDRKQELPEVTEVQVVESRQDPFQYEMDGEIKEDEQAYFINYTITYKKDMGYAEDVTLVLVHRDNKLEIAEMRDQEAE